MRSTRLPEKLLLRVSGKSILQHTFEAASRARVSDSVVVAVDDDRLAEEVDAFGGEWIMTPADCASGTDRIAVVAQQTPDMKLFVNVQGDEPEIEAETIDRLVEALIDASDADMATAGTPIRDAALLNDPHCVKIVLAAEQGRAVYFSRAAVPFDRDENLEIALRRQPALYWQHLGLYAYRREFLAWFAAQPPSRLESAERLEQLRAIEAGKRIAVIPVATATPGIDTRDDYEAFRTRQEGRQ